MLRLNTFNYPNVLPLHGGLWPVMGYSLPTVIRVEKEPNVIYGVEVEGHLVIVIAHDIHVYLVIRFIQSLHVVIIHIY